MKTPRDIEFIYLVTVDGEWPVSVLADDHPNTVSRIEYEVNRRTEPFNNVRVWRAKITDLAEMELIPSHTVDPQVRVKDTEDETP